MARILLVEDDPDFSSLIKAHLEHLQYQVVTCDNGLQGWTLFQASDFDLVILDLGLPGMDGLEICKRIRQQDVITPVLILTARDTELDRVLGLEIGADDYLGKPFGMRELEARIKAILRRVALMSRFSKDNEQQDTLRFDGLEITPVQRKVLCRGKDVELTAREFDLLFYLASRPGRVYNREQLLDRIWGYTNNVFEHTVNSNINRLRNKIEKDSTKPEYIITVRGVGYKFNDAIS